MPTPLNSDLVDAYAYSDLPGAGVIEANGPCGIAPVMIKDLPIVLSCALQIKANAANGIQGGLITSNSLVNTLNRTDSAPTGSVWTAGVIGSETSVGGGSTAPPAGTKPDTPGLDFYTLRSRAETANGDPAECKRAGAAATPDAVRTIDLAVTQPDVTTGRVPDAAGPTVAKMSVCYLYANRFGYRAAAIATLKAGGKTFDVRASGDCRTTTTVASPDLRAQACALTVKGNGLNGLITSNGLIEKDRPASAANSALWSFALFGAPTAS